MDSSQPRARLAYAWLAGSVKVSWPRHQLSPHRTLVTSPTHLLHRHCICLRISSQMSGPVNQLQGVPNFHPMTPSPFLDVGGGSHSVFQKHIFKSIICIFEKRQLKYKHFSYIFHNFLALRTPNWSKNQLKTAAT